MAEQPGEQAHDDSATSGLGERIRRYRRDRNLSLNQLADQAGVSKGYLSALENEKSSSTKSRRPSADTLYAIAKVLGVTMSDLLGRRLLITETTETPESLRKFAEEETLPETDVAMLKAIQFRGEHPRTVERWRYIYTAIRVSESMDE
jgi:transcriptional regulator with XRE-family HTH domain